MNFPTLYSRTSKGGIQTWKIEVTGNSYVMVTGLIDGKKTTSKPTVVKGKNIGRANETTPEAQALSEAQSKFDKKAKTGYFVDIAQIDNMAYIEPILANKYFDRIAKDKVTYPVIVQCKFNGARCIVTKNGMHSRKGEEYLTCPHIADALKPFFERYPDAVLDGELFNEGLRESLNELMKLVRRTVNITPQHLADSREKVRLYLYDGYGFDGLLATDSYALRKPALDALADQVEFLEKVRDFQAVDHEAVMKVYDGFLAENHEGGMVRFPAMKYKSGRSNELLKVKPLDDDEGIILDVFLGVGNWSGVAKTAKLLWKGIEFDATWKCDHASADEIWKNRTFWIGKKVTFLYNGLTGLGTPNYARIDLKNCLKE